MYVCVAYWMNNNNNMIIKLFMGGEVAVLELKIYISCGDDKIKTKKVYIQMFTSDNKINVRNNID